MNLGIFDHARAKQHDAKSGEPQAPSNASDQHHHWSKKLVKRISKYEKADKTKWELPASDLDPYILSGRVKHLPRRNPKIVRIFLSSTFTDMYEERNALFKRVYPKLQSYCHTKLDVDFQVVDMRWGVRSAATNDHSGAKLCMAELKTCQEESLGPNFVLLLGQRYGSRPIPPVIKETEFEKLVIALTALQTADNDIEFLQKWYMCDSNSQPSLRRLQPLDSMMVEPKEFTRSVEPRLRQMLRTAANKCLEEKGITEKEHRPYFWSVTDEEVFNGILGTENPNDHCLCFTRYIQDINFQNDKVGRFVDMLDAGGIDEEAQELRDVMHRRVYDVLDKGNIKEFTVQWCDKGGINEDVHAAYLNDFCEAFYSKVKELIDKATKDNAILKMSQSQVLMEVSEHSHQAKDKFETFQGRTDVLNSIKDYVTGNGEPVTKESVPLTIYGGSGFGKTSILAVASINAFQWLSGSGDILIIRRFLGTTPDSTNVESLVKSIARQVTTYWDFRMPHVKDPLLILEPLLNGIPNDATLVIFLDSLDQLSAAGKAHSLVWLPEKLPTNVKMIVSTLPDEHGLLDILQARGYPENMFVSVEVLDVNMSLELLKGYLSSKQKKLTDHQMRIVSSKIQSASPLYIKLIFDILRDTTSYMGADDFAKRFEPLHSPGECIQYIIEQLRKKHGFCLVDTAFAFLHLSNQGLTENEIVHLLSLDEVVLDDAFQFHMPPLRRLPAVLWARIRHDVSEYIVERDAKGSKVLAWYHRQFIEAGRRKFVEMCPKERIRELQQIMVDYFMGVWAKGKLKPFVYSDPMVKKLQLSSNKAEADRFVPEQPNILTNKKPNLRKLTQLPMLLVATKKLDTFLNEIIGSVESLVSMFETYTWTEIYQLLDQVQGEAINDAYSKYAYASILKCLLLSSATASRCPSSLGPLIAGRLLPFYGASTLIDRLLNDIYSKGVERNAFVAPHNQLEGFGSYLLFEMTNDHTGPCYSIREVVYKGRNYIMSVSQIAAMIDMENGNITFRYDPQLQNGDHFNILKSVKASDPEYIAASLTQVPKVFVFSVKLQECTGSFDCRKVDGCKEFLINDMLAFRVGKEELVAVWGTSLHGLLLYGLKDCQLFHHVRNENRIFAVILHDKCSLALLQAGKLKFLNVKFESKKFKEVNKTRKLRLPLPGSLLVTAEHFDKTGLIALAAADNKLFLWDFFDNSGSRVILDSPAHCITSRRDDVLVCTKHSVYSLSIDKKGAAKVTWHIHKQLDWAGYTKSHTVVGYRLGSISVFRIADFETRIEVYEDLTFVGHAKPITNIIINAEIPSMCMTSSADGTIRIFDRSREINKLIAEMSNFDRMDVHIDIVRGCGRYAITIAKDNRMAAVWELSTGKILHRLYHEAGSNLKEALVLGQIIVTVDASGMIYIWNLDDDVSAPYSTVALYGFHSMIAKSERELMVLSKEAITELSLPSGAVVMRKPLPENKRLISYSWRSDGLALLVDPNSPAVVFDSEAMHVSEPLVEVKGLRAYGQQISSLYCGGKIIVLAYAQHVVFYNYDKKEVLTSVPMKRPILLKSHSTTVGARSGLNLHFFDVTSNGIAKLGTLKLSTIEDLSVLSSDGLHCLVTKLPKLVRLYRLSDMAEVGAYSCYGNVESMTLSSDCEHALIGISDTRLLAFRLVDHQCKGHLDRLQGILQKPSTPGDISTKKSMLAAAGQLQDDNEDYADDSADSTEQSTKNKQEEVHSQSIDINEDNVLSEKQKHANALAYVRNIISSRWKRYSLNTDVHVKLRWVKRR